MVFEVINARGEKLKPYEILKGELLGQIKKDNLEPYLKTWNDSISLLQSHSADPDKSIDAFFTPFLRARYAKTPSDVKEFEKDYHKAIFSKKYGEVFNLKRNERRVKEFIEKEFLYYVKVYDELVRIKDEYGKLPYIHFNKLNSLGNQFYLLLSNLTINDLEKSEKLNLVSKLLDRNYSLLQIFGGYDSNKFAESLRRLTIDIRDKNFAETKQSFDKELIYLIAEKRGMEMSDIFYYPFFSTAGHDNLNYSFIRYFFSRIEKFLASEINESVYPIKDLAKNSGWVNGHHIEHILAKNEENLQIFSSEEEFVRERNRLGALLLIKSNDNSSSGAEIYRNKLKTYSHQTIWAKTLTQDFHHKNTSFKDFKNKYNLNIEPVDEFDGKAVEERQKLLFEMTKIIWGTI